MSEIYTVIVGILGILAVSGLFVGVTNDAVNFLNSAIGSKAASMKVILTVASVGIIIGVVTSSGMMEVARNGMFDPGMFSFHEVILLYLSVMFANIILLDLYNSWGLPTSTTVSLIFCLLGAYICRNKVNDLFIMMVFSILAIFLKKYNYSLPAFLLGVILGPIIEPNFFRALAISNNDYSIFFTRPICIVLWLMCAATLLMPKLISRRTAKKGVESK